MRIDYSMMATVSARKRITDELGVKGSVFFWLQVSCWLQQKKIGFFAASALRAYSLSGSDKELYSSLQWLELNGYIEKVREGQKFVRGLHALYNVTNKGKQLCETHDLYVIEFSQQLLEKEDKPLLIRNRKKKPLNK